MPLEVSDPHEGASEAEESLKRARDALSRVLVVGPRTQEAFQRIEALCHESLRILQGWTKRRRGQRLSVQDRSARKRDERRLKKLGIFEAWARRAKTLHDIGEAAAKNERESCKKRGEDDDEVAYLVPRARERAVRAAIGKIGTIRPEDVGYWLEASECRSELEYKRRYSLTERELRRKPEARRYQPKTDETV